MIAREARARGIVSRALYSPCETYRYLLTRHWGDGPVIGIVMLNPSTATETANDPTIERCQRRATALGYGGMEIANLFALRATDPRALRSHPEPIGPEADDVLAGSVGRVDRVLAAWGVHGALGGRAATVAPVLPDPHCLGTTQAGHPRHPLYVAYAIRPRPWPGYCEVSGNLPTS